MFQWCFLKNRQCWNEPLHANNFYLLLEYFCCRSIYLKWGQSYWILSWLLNFPKVCGSLYFLNKFEKYYCFKAPSLFFSWVLMCTTLSVQLDCKIPKLWPRSRNRTFLAPYKPSCLSQIISHLTKGPTILTLTPLKWLHLCLHFR